VLGVKELVTNKLKCAPVKAVSSSFRHYHDLAPRAMTVLSRKNPCQNPEFLDRVNRRQKSRTVDSRVVVVNPVEAEVVFSFGSSSHVESPTVPHGGIFGWLIGIGSQQGKTVKLTSVQRQFHDLPVVDHLAS